MPIVNFSNETAYDRFLTAFNDIARRAMQLTGLAVVVLYGYIIYGLFIGPGSNWAMANHDQRLVILANIQGALHWVTIALGLFLATVVAVYFDEQLLAYGLVGLAVLAYYGIPLILDLAFPGQVAEWVQTGNGASLAMLTHMKIAGIMMAIPGGILLLRDIFLRVYDRIHRRDDEFTEMEYGGKVQEEDNVGRAIIGAFAKCWQLPYCREAIRKKCPIFLSRRRCWKERVGCMCEERVITGAMDSLINKELITFGDPVPAVDDGLVAGVAAGPGGALGSLVDKTVQIPPAKLPNRKDVAIPYNTTLSDFAKRERCRNCVIFNEHERMKYQLLAPLLVVGVPALAWWQMGVLTVFLGRTISVADRIMSRLSFDSSAKSGMSGSLAQTDQVALFMLQVCLIVVLTTMALRALEYLLFKVKI